MNTRYIRKSFRRHLVEAYALDGLMGVRLALFTHVGNISERAYAKKLFYMLDAIEPEEAR